MKLHGRAMLHYSLATLATVDFDRRSRHRDSVGMERKTRDEVARAGLEVPVKITPGGLERQDSVRIALALTSAEAEVIIIHDAARPFADATLFRRCLEAAFARGAAIAAIPVSDTLKRVGRRRHPRDDETRRTVSGANAAGISAPAAGRGA